MRCLPLPLLRERKPMPIVPVRGRRSNTATTPDLSDPTAHEADPPTQELRSGPAEPDPGNRVGYGRPPKHSRFQPGKSGNPKGRPKRAKNLKTIVRAVMEEMVRVRSSNGERRVSRAEALVLKTLELASKDNLRATERLLEWYQDAVPDEVAHEARQPRSEELTQTDEAILTELRKSIEAELLAGGAEGDTEEPS